VSGSRDASGADADDKVGKPGLLDRATARLDAARRRNGLLNHAVDTVLHYGNVKGTVLAGAVTYFGFLSFFPVLALAFAAVGYVARAYPEAESDLLTALQDVLPGLVGAEDSDAPIKISTFTDAAGTATVFGVVGLLYTGLGWLSGLREALQTVFGVPPGDARNLVMGKVYDLLTLVLLGVILVVSVSLSGAVTGSLELTLEWLRLDGVPGMGLLAWAVAIALGVGVTTTLFLTMFKLLPNPDLPWMALVKGALFGALGFEVLKALANTLIAWATKNPAFALLGVSLVLLVYINYFSRITLLAASWAAMSAEGKPVLARREVEEVERIIGGQPQVPATAGTFRDASTEAGGAAPWPADLPADHRNTAALTPRGSDTGGDRGDTRAHTGGGPRTDPASLATGALAGAAVTAAWVAVRNRHRAHGHRP
jgi:membrane protein